MAHTLTLDLPEDLYERLKKRTEKSQHTLETELLEVVAAAVTTNEQTSATPAKTPEELGWPPGFFEQTAGSIPDYPDIPYEGDFEVREELD